MARVGVDLDGVVVDFVDSYRQHCKKSHRKILRFPEPDHWEFYKDKEWGSQAASAFQDCLRHFDSIFADAKPYPGAIKALQCLLDAGHKIVFITDRGINPRAESITVNWLNQRMTPGEYELHITADKASVPVQYFIDDKSENLGAMPGSTEVYLCDRPWNQDSGYERMTLDQFVDEVIRSEESLAQLKKLFAKASPLTAEEVRVTSSTGGQKGQKQARIGSIDPLALMEMAKVAGFGEQKYARLNYLNGYDWSLSYDACQRHLNAFWSGEDLDPESGLPHLAHAGWHCMAMLAFMIHKLGTDDRFKKPEAAA